MAFTFYGRSFQTLRLTIRLVTHYAAPTTPRSPRGTRFGLFPFRSPLQGELSFLSFPPGTKMFQFPGCPLPVLYIQTGVIVFDTIGFPHSEISGSKGAGPSPELIAAGHVLHRLLMPRHPPCALGSLTFRENILDNYSNRICSFQGALRKHTIANAIVRRDLPTEEFRTYPCHPILSLRSIGHGSLRIE